MSNFGFRDNKIRVKGLIIEDESGEPGAVVTYSLAQCASAVSTGAILTGYVLKSIGTADFGYGISSFAKQPPYALNMVLVANGNQTGHGDADRDPFTIVGYNKMGEKIRETLYVPSVANATTSTKQAFTFISTISQRVGTASSSADVGLSWGDIIGLPFPIATSDDIIAFTNGTQGATTMPPVGSNGYNTIQPTLMEDGQQIKNDFISDIKMVAEKAGFIK